VYFPNNRMTIVRRDIKFDEGKAMWLSLERELKLHAEEELLAPKDVSQGKYAMEILGKFHMEGCKPIDTPLPGNWRKEDATSGEVVDIAVYRQLVGSLIYLVNMRPDICYVVN
jgi:hypothetical protein